MQRFIRLTELIPPILQMVDEGKIALTPAVELSFLKKDEQENFFATMTTPKQMEETIIKLLERELQRKRNRDSR